MIRFEIRSKPKVNMGMQFKRLVLQLFVVCATVSSSDTSNFGQIQLDYSVIQATGKFCPGRDSCQIIGRQNRGPEGIENDWKKRNCFCDNLCSDFGDCCIDASAYNQSEQSTRHSQFDCVNFKQYGDLYVRSKCPSEWNDTKIRNACEKQDELKDPFGSTPVTNAETGFTYQNYFCAVCNEDNGDLQFWSPRLECNTLMGYASRFGNMSTSFIAERLHFDPNRNNWGVNIDTGGVPVFHECYVDPVMPDTLADRVRSCSGKSTINSCPKGYENATVNELCQSYTALIFEPNIAYRNVHCALCNNAILDRLICLNLGPFGRMNWQQNFNAASFAVLFDLSGDESSSVGFVRSSCQDGELFDPFFKKCRNVICGSDNKIYRKGRCIPSSIESSTTTTSISSSTTTTTSTTSTTTAKPPVTTITPPPTTTVSETTTYPEIETTIRVEYEEVALTTSEIETIFGNETTPKNNQTEAVVNTTQSSQEENRVESETTLTQEVHHEHSTNFIDCPKIELQVGEFKMMNSNSVYIEKYDQSLGSEEFDLANNNNVLIICATLAGGTDQIGKFGQYMSYVTLAGLGVSVISLILHLIATLLTPDLQNLSGKNLFSLCVALLGSDITFIAAMFRSKDDEVAKDGGCFVLAVVLYFFFMASFFWMLVIAFDVCRSLRIATTKLRLTTGSQWKKFTVYSIFAWVLPLTFAVITIVVEKLRDEVPAEYRPGFGEEQLCWFSSKKALLVYFAVPFAGIMGFNIFLFLFSAHIVYNTTKSGAKMTSCVPRINFHLYLRLAVIMGLTWVTGLAAGFINLEPLWYAFVGLNTLQGLFIFIAFTCTKKVLESLKERLICGRSASITVSGSGGANSFGGPISRTANSSRLNDDASWKWSKDTASTSAGSTGKRSEMGTDSEKGGGGESLDSTIPSRYGSRSKTMYTVSKYQANCSSSNQNSFDGRYY